MGGMSGRICGSAGGAQDEVILFFLAPYYPCRDSAVSTPQVDHQSRASLVQKQAIDVDIIV